MFPKYYYFKYEAFVCVRISDNKYIYISGITQAYLGLETKSSQLKNMNTGDVIDLVAPWNGSPPSGEGCVVANSFANTWNIDDCQTQQAVVCATIAQNGEL